MEFNSFPFGTLKLSGSISHIRILAIKALMINMKLVIFAHILKPTSPKYSRIFPPTVGPIIKPADPIELKIPIACARSSSLFVFTVMVKNDEFLKHG